MGSCGTVYGCMCFLHFESGGGGGGGGLFCSCNMVVSLAGGDV